MWIHPSERIKVLVWLSEPLLQAGVSATLSNRSDVRVVDCTQLASEDGVDVLVTDWSFSQLLASQGRQPWLPAITPETKVLVFSLREGDLACASPFRGGVHGLVSVDCSCEELLEAVRSMARGGLYACPPADRAGRFSPAGNSLTGREEEVLRLLARGQCNKSISRQLGIAVGTVKTHIKGILSKLGASSRTEAASIAIVKGWSTLGSAQHGSAYGVSTRSA